MTRFDVLQAMTDVEKYAEMIFFILRNHQNEEEFERFLNSELPEEGRQCIEGVCRFLDAAEDLKLNMSM